MLVFFDESGDTGFKLASGSSPLFTVTMIVFEQHDAAQSADDRISNLRTQLRKSPNYEFHFTQCSDSIRTAFFEAVSGEDFYFFSFVIDKSQLQGLDFQSADSFYRYVCGLIFESAKPYLDNAIVKLDGRGGREFRRQLGGYLKRRINDEESDRKYIKKVVSPSSDRNNLIQLADMVCGAVARAQLGERKNAQEFYRRIRHREIWTKAWP